MATITAIDGRSIHQIQSGQVIVDLNSVVKELVENSLDAGATSIEVRFRDQGLDAIEIQDNGKGIAPDDFETLALKHYTSKLSEYDDLSTLETFGFRGEALSSLCALSRFTVTTARSEDGAVGRKLEFDVSGRLKGTSIAAAQKGTTVTVEELFYNLPVRRRELDKNIKREYGKALNLLYHNVSKGKKVPLFSTKGNATTKDNITNVFGAKTLTALCGLDLHLEMTTSLGPSTQDARNWSTQAVKRTLKVHVQGHISKPVFGEGRQAPDRQMFFVNARPCQLPQVSKAINEVYKSFNISQSPFVFANLVMDTNTYDVNVSPDKRTIMLHDQTALLESLKTGLTELFEQTDHTVPQSTLPDRKLPGYQRLSMSRPESTDRTTDGVEPSTNEDHGINVESPPSLIHDWVGRDAEPRREPRAKPMKSTLNCASNVDSSRLSPQRITAKATTDSVEATATDSEVIQTQGPSTCASCSPVGPTHDYILREGPLLHGSVEGTDAQQSSPSADRGPAVEQHEPQIPVLAPASLRSTAGPVQNAFDRMRPRRPPSQIAEITIGDTTTTAIVGSDSPFKKRRIHRPADSQAVAKYGASPHLAEGLRRNFAAPGSQLHINSSAASEAADQESSAGGDAPEDSDGTPAVERLANDAPGQTSSDSPNSPDLALGSETSPFVAKMVTDIGRTTGWVSPDTSLFAAPSEHDSGDDYLDEGEKRLREEDRIARLINDAEEATARPSEENVKRAQQVLKNGGNRKNCTLQLVQHVKTSIPDVKMQLDNAARGNLCRSKLHGLAEASALIQGHLDDAQAEERLSLTVSKSDFEQMVVVGQFNLGFILALRKALSVGAADDLFIIDQHAADEKYNYERLGRTASLQSQRLVRPKDLELTAMQQETILGNRHVLRANGFEIATDASDASGTFNDYAEASPESFRLLTLPMSKERTFDLSDLEELLHLVSEQPAGSTSIPRPIKVQKLLAMRACRSSIMVGKTLTHKQMTKVVRHLGEMDKPWNCPHGRPTMRHIAGLREWKGWREGELIANDERDACNAQKGGTDWGAWLAKRSRRW